MPRLPGAFDLSTSGPSPSRNVVSPTTGAVERAAAEGGRAISDLGRTISVVAAQEQDRLDRLKVDDRLTQLMAKELELTQQYQSVKTAGVLEKDFHDSSAKAYDQTIDTIGGDLTPSQRAEFDKVAKRRRVQFDAGRITYAVNEAEKYHTAAHQSRIELRNEAGAQGYADPSRLQEAAMGVDVDTAKELSRKGITNPEDPIAKSTLAEARSAFWGGVLDRALSDNNIEAAKTLYASAKGLLTTKQREAFDSRIKPLNDFAEGQSLATAARQMLDAGKPLSEVEATLAKASSPGAYNAAQTIFNNFQQAKQIADAESEGTVYEMFARNGNNGTAMQMVLGSQEYAKLPEAIQGKVAVFMQRETAQAEREARMERRQAISDAREDIRWSNYKADREEAKKREADAFKGLGTLIATMEDPRFVTMSRAELYAMAPEVGKDGVAKLLTEQANLQKGAASFKIDKDILDAAIPEELLGKSNKDKLNAFRGHVESVLMDWKQANPGKVPDPETQRRIANSANAKWQEVKDWWPDSTHAAYGAPPPAFEEELQAAAKRKGKLPLTKDQVNRAWRAQSLQGSVKMTHDGFPARQNPDGSVKMTHDGFPARQNPDGSYSTEISITVTDPKINGGKPTNIPSLWEGREVDQATAIKKAIASGKKYQSFATIKEAVEAAVARSKAGGANGAKDNNG